MVMSRAQTFLVHIQLLQGNFSCYLAKSARLGDHDDVNAT